MPINPDNPTSTPLPPVPPAKLSARIMQAVRRAQPLLFAALLCSLLFGIGSVPALNLWVTLNFVYGATAATWAMFHWRPLWNTRDVSLRWAVCLTLALTLQLYSGPKGIWASQIAAPVRSVSNVSDALWFIMAGLVAGLFCLLMLLGLAGASVGAFAGRRSDDMRRASHLGVHICMMTFSAALLLWTLPPPQYAGFGSLLGVALALGFPLLTRGYWRWTHTRLPHQPRLQRVWQVAAKRLLIRRFMWRGQNVTLDGRGAVLGLMIGGTLLALPPFLIGPLQSQTFSAMRHLGQSVMNSKTPYFTPPTEQERSAFTNDRRLDALKTRRRIAILRLDDTTRYEASQHSEAYVQADMILRLHKMGAACIIVPLPCLSANEYPLWASAADGVAPTKDDMARNRADIGLLCRALRQCPDAVLALPAAVDEDTVDEDTVNKETANKEVVNKDEAAHQLAEAASWQGWMNIAWSPTSFLPVIPSSWNAAHALPPVAAYAGAALNAPAFLHTRHTRLQTLRDFPGSARPQVDADGVLVDFFGDGPREDFLHVSYSTVRADLLLRDVSTGPDSKPAQEQKQWQKASEMLRGRVVFLDSLAHPMQVTPMGAITQAEEQAYAVSTLVAGESFRRVPPWLLAVLTLLSACVVGHICARSEPLDAVIRGLLPLFFILILSTVGLLETTWIDPVVPTLAVILSLALATQLRFTRERGDKQRASELFGRFVAPHMVQTWLAQSHEELGLGGKREKLCILFADVRGFTPFTEQHDAGVVIDVINAYMTALTDALHAYDGILDKYTGDGLMAFFQVAQTADAPTPASTITQKTRRVAAPASRLSAFDALAPHTPADDIARAVQAALAMRDAATNLSIIRALEGRPTLQIGFSLHYGEVVIGLVGNIKQQVNYTALGLAVVVAARLQTIAAGGQVIVSEDVYRETQDRFEFAADKPVQVKGLSAPVHPYRVIAAKESDL